MTLSRTPGRLSFAFWRKHFMGVCLAGMVGCAIGAEPEKEVFSFSEVYELLKANLAGTTEAELNRAAVRGLLDQLAAKVTVVGELPRVIGQEVTNAPITATLFDGNYGYFRVSRLQSGADQEFQTLVNRLRATNLLKGLVIDLRFTGGNEYMAAVALADRFLANERELVDWGEGWKSSTSKTNAITLPVAILVNRKTMGAAEVLAGILRHRQVGLLIGTNTAGQASMAKEFALKSGQRLRLAIAPVKVADGKELPFTGVPADIGVDVSPEDELGWYEDAYKVLPKLAAAASTNDTGLASTNRPVRRRVNEAELVRMNRDGQNPDRDIPFTNAPGRTFEPLTPVVNDPALVRALDLLKGLAVVQQFRSI
jgi:C-terminal processing protease CtpA/Prc